MPTGPEINDAIKSVLRIQGSNSGLGQASITNGVQELLKVDLPLRQDIPLAVLLLLAQYRTMPGLTGSVLCHSGLYSLNANGGKDAFILFPLVFADEGIAPAAASSRGVSIAMASAENESTPRSSRRRGGARQPSDASFSSRSAETETIHEEFVEPVEVVVSSSVASNDCCELLNHLVALQTAGIINADEFVHLSKNIVRSCQG